MAAASGEVQSVSRALRLISALAEAGNDAGVHELARFAHLHVATAHRLLRTLLAEGVVEQDGGSSRYRLGPVVLRWAEAYLASAELRRAARPCLEELAARTGETVHLMVLGGDAGVYVDRVDSPQRLRVATPVGQREPLHCSAVGKALLAFLPPATRARVLSAGLPRRTPRTITDPGELEEHLGQVRRAGYALDDGEGEVGVRCVGAPIFGRTGTVVGALSVAAPAARLPRAQAEALGDVVRAAAADVSRRLGHTDTVGTAG